MVRLQVQFTFSFLTWESAFVSLIGQAASVSHKKVATQSRIAINRGLLLWKQIAEEDQSKYNS